MIYAPIVYYIFFYEEKRKHRYVSPVYDEETRYVGKSFSTLPEKKKKKKKKEKKETNAKEIDHDFGSIVDSVCFEKEELIAKEIDEKPVVVSTLATRSSQSIDDSSFKLDSTDIFHSYPGYIHPSFAKYLRRKHICFRIGCIPSQREREAQDLAIRQLQLPLLAREIDIICRGRRIMSCDLVFQWDNSLFFVEAKKTMKTTKLFHQCKTRHIILGPYLEEKGVEAKFCAHLYGTRQFVDADGRVLKPPLT